MMGAGMDSTMAKKVTNDAVAYLESIAEDRDRNAEWASPASWPTPRTSPPSEALEENVIDLVVATRSD